MLAQSSVMTWKTIRLELARTPEYPEGSVAHAYVLRLPLDPEGVIDEEAFRAERDRAVVRRLWRGEPEQSGLVIRKRRGWAFSYEPGDDDDEGIFHLETHPIRLGEYLTLTEADGERLPFKVVHCHD
jgi:hypothetical protein